MEIRHTGLDGLLQIRPKVHGDERGWFLEAFNDARLRAAGLALEVRQANVSRSRRGVLRGLHFQLPKAQGKLVYVVEGEVYDVAVDLRPHSPTYRQWFGERLSAENHHMLYLPPGFAHGFQVLSEHATFCYFCTELYDPACDRALRFDDPAIGVAWPLPPGELSAKDRMAPTLDQVEELLHAHPP